MLVNFLGLGIDPGQIHVIFSYVDRPSYEAIELRTKYQLVNFFYYERSVVQDHPYPPVVRPDALEKHFLKYTHLRGEVIFYHDCDVIFRELPDFSKLYHDQYWYLSDTVSYIGANYIDSKSPSLLDSMCKLIAIDPLMVRQNELNSGGAQYLIKGVTHTFWKEVKVATILLYDYLSRLEEFERIGMSESELADYNPIQKWCSDMWAVLWCAWKYGAQTRISNELSFSWATSPLDEYRACKILHNAGVTPDIKDTHFFKGDFIDSIPFGRDFSYVDKESASAKYCEAISLVKV
jgi:hypothetical protein